MDAWTQFPGAGRKFRCEVSSDVDHMEFPLKWTPAGRFFTHGLSTPMFLPLCTHTKVIDFPSCLNSSCPQPFLGETPSCFFLLHSFTFFE